MRHFRRILELLPYLSSVTVVLHVLNCWALENDHKSFLAFTTEESIHTFFEDDFSKSPFPPIKNKAYLRTPYGLSHDWTRQNFFTSDWDSGTVVMASFNASEFKFLLTNHTGIGGIYYESVSEYLYFTNYDDAEISRIQPYANGKDTSRSLEVIIRLKSDDELWGLEVDSCESMIYFCNARAHGPAIQRCSTNGSHLETIIDTDIIFPRSLVLDQRTKELFWADTNIGKIERADFKGRNRKVLVSQQSGHLKGDVYGIAVSLFYVFWADAREEAMFRASRRDGGGMLAVRRDVDPGGVVFVTEQRRVTDPCATRPNLQNLNLQSRNRTFGLGQRNQSLSCIYESTPSTSVEWFQNGQVKTGSVEQGLNSNSTIESRLQFDLITSTDEGNYSCVVANGLDVESLNFSIKSCEACVPSINKSDRRRVLVQGSTGQLLSCRYNSSSNTNVTWTHNGTLKPEFQSDYRGVNGESESTILLLTTDWEQGGSYECQVTSKYGQDRFEFKVEIIEAEEMYGVIYVLTGASILALFLLLSVLFLWQRYNKVKNIVRHLTEQEVTEFFDGNPDFANKSRNDGNVMALHMPFDRKLELSKDKLEMDKSSILGQGQFGIVYRGQLEGATVAVKTLKTHAGVEYLKSLLSELKIMAYIDSHQNIVRLIGAHTSQLREHDVQVVVEFSPFGDLHSFLSKNRSDFSNDPENVTHEYENTSNPPLSLNDFIYWSSQIASGMNHLEQKKVVHADLAARNVLVFNNSIVKISDFGLSRQLYNYTKYIKKSKTPVPYRWMARESLRFMEFTSQSDIWAYGVTVWEIFTLGQVPFAEHCWSQEFVRKLDQGLRLPQPSNASTQIYEALCKCWHANPKQRATFNELQQFFGNMFVLTPTLYQNV